MGFDLSRIGWSRDSEEFRVNTARLAAFAHALDDDNVEHLAGRSAPPVFAHVPVMQSMVEVLGAVTPDFPIHGEHDFHFHHPIEPGQRLFSRSTAQGIRQTGAGVAIVIKSETKTETGVLVNAQFTTGLIRNATVAKTVGEMGPDRPAGNATGGPSSEGTHEIAIDQTRRYADAARDYSPYALDEAAAKSRGFPAPIMHGMCTLGFASRAVIDQACAANSRRLKRLGGRFSQLVLMRPGQRLVTRLRHGAVRDGRQTIEFETKNAEGQVVIKNGFAEILP